MWIIFNFGGLRRSFKHNLLIICRTIYLIDIKCKVNFWILASKNTDGLSLEIEGNGINSNIKPLEDLSDEEDIKSDNEKDESLDDMEGIKAVSI